MSKKIIAGFCLLPFLVSACFAALAGGLFAWRYIRPQPAELSEVLFKGVTYERVVRNDPRPMVIHVVTANLAEEGLDLLVTPGKTGAELPLKARTTSQFLSEFDLQVAVNGDGFEPWYDHSILRYYPHSGDPVDVIGFAASGGRVYSEDTDREPTLYISKNNRLSLHNPIGRMDQALSGNQLLIDKGEIEPREGGDIQPRTAVGIGRNDRRLILVVVDGRQANYSQGATLFELAQILFDYGAYHAINLDGGGSSTLVVGGSLGKPRVLNSPVNHRIPGLQRPVGNHLGISISR